MAWALVAEVSRVHGVAVEMLKQQPDLERGLAKRLQKFTADVHARFPADMRTDTAVVNDGRLTNQRLESVFRKCLTPGAEIRVGAVGGSITKGGGASGSGVSVDTAYQTRYAGWLQRMCPHATVTVVQGGKGTSNSFLPAMCLPTILGDMLDVLFTEFALNDYNSFPNRGESYELLMRSALSLSTEAKDTHASRGDGATATESADGGAPVGAAGAPGPPAVMGIHFWGPDFIHDTNQEVDTKVLRHYGISGISIRDVVWPYYIRGQAPYDAKEHVCTDRHHPTNAVHAHLADILALYTAQRFLAWLLPEAHLASLATGGAERAATVAAAGWGGGLRGSGLQQHGTVLADLTRPGDRSVMPPSLLYESNALFDPSRGAACTMIGEPRMPDVAEPPFADKGDPGAGGGVWQGVREGWPFCLVPTTADTAATFELGGELSEAAAGGGGLVVFINCIEYVEFNPEVPQALLSVLPPAAAAAERGGSGGGGGGGGGGVLGGGGEALPLEMRQVQDVKQVWYAELPGRGELEEGFRLRVASGPGAALARLRGGERIAPKYVHLRPGVMAMIVIPAAAAAA